MSQSKFSLSEMQELDTLQERQHLAIKLFNQAMEDDDAATAIDVAEFVIGDEQMNVGMGAGFQMHCLVWLARHYRNLYSQTADNSPEEDLYFDKLFHALWQFKWIVARLPYDINMTRDEITQTNELMQQFYEHFEFGQSALAKTLMHQSMKMGDIQAAQRHFQAWQSNQADFANDCAACEQSSLLEYHHFIGDYARVIELAEPILSGEMTCGEVPHIAYEFVIDSLIRTNQREAAQNLLDEAFDVITENIDVHLHLLPALIYLASKLEQNAIAKDLLDDYNEDILELAPNNRLYYLEYLTCVAPFNDEAVQEAQDVAAQFDERNGNSFYQDKLALMLGKMRVH